MKKTVLVTGASRGIGRAIAEAFAREGHRLVITCSHSEAELSAFAQTLRKEYRADVLTSVGNAGDDTYAGELYERIRSRFHGVDILLNNAGISHIGLLSDMTIDEWNHIVTANLTSVFTMSRHAIPWMVHQKRGKIINISSVWGITGASCEVAYSACKGGVNAFTKALAKELAPSGIQVNAIACGVIDTQMNACFTAEEREALMNEIPAGRFGQPDEAASLALQLAAGSEYLTGQIITLDGGWT